MAQSPKSYLDSLVIASDFKSDITVESVFILHLKCLFGFLHPPYSYCYNTKLDSSLDTWTTAIASQLMFSVFLLVICYIPTISLKCHFTRSFPWSRMYSESLLSTPYIPFIWFLSWLLRPSIIWLYWAPPTLLFTWYYVSLIKFQLSQTGCYYYHSLFHKYLLRQRGYNWEQKRCGTCGHDA